MDKYYQLWDLTSRNVVGDFDTVEEVFDALAEAYGEAGLELTDDYMLLVFEGSSSSLFAQGKDLTDLVKNHQHAVSR